MGKTITFDISAVDGRNVADFFKGNEGEIATAISQATRLAEDTFIYVVQTVAVEQLAGMRRTTFQDRPFRVVPAALVRSQVLHNNIGAAFLPAEEITDAWADQWNGIPVLVGEHPRQRGEPISGRAPELWDERLGGWIFEARVEDEGDGNRRLVAEVWLDESRAESVDGLQAILDRLDAGESVELSTGFATQLERRTGVHNGEQYEVVMRPRGADHLVISTEITGACAVRDGCGLGVNEGEEPEERNMAENKQEEEERTFLTRVVQKAGEWLSLPKPDPMTAEEYRARLLAREVEIWNQLNPSDNELAQMLRDALQNKFGGADREVMVADVFSGSQVVVYWVSTPMGPQPPGAEFFRSTYEQEGESTNFTFSEPVQVRRMVKYEPVEGAANAGNEGDTAVAAAGNGSSNGEEEAGQMDENKGEGQNCVTLETIAGVVDKMGEAINQLAAEMKEIKEASKADPNIAVAGLKEEIAKLSTEFAEMRGVTAAAVKEREREHAALVASLAGNYRVAYTEDELREKPIEELRKLQSMARGENYEGRGGARDPEGQLAQGRFVEPKPYWEKDE